jgi:membrane associated rhomboid family serine protease
MQNPAGDFAGSIGWQGFCVLIPYNTDAPLYHFPFATIGLIAVNVVAFGVILRADELEVVPWTLQFGEGLHPLQWVTNNFLHADILHIAGNMFFLWGFGLVVEGKLGWWRFLVLYLTIGTIYGAIIQTAMLGSQGLALGASGAIFGLLVIALIWAPKNEMSCFLWLFRPMLVELPITIFAATYLIWQGIVAWLTNFSMSSAMLHLTGAGVGAVFGVALLKLDWVDCEGWDLFALWKGHVGSRPEPVSRTTQPASAPQPASLDGEQTQFLIAALRKRLTSGDAAGAAQLYKQQRESLPAWKPNAADLMALIQALHQQKLWSESVSPMTDYLRQHPENSVRVRLNLAQILIDADHRPAKALKVLSKVQPSELPAELQAVYKKLVARAGQRQVESEFEFVDDEDV